MKQNAKSTKLTLLASLAVSTLILSAPAQAQQATEFEMPAQLAKSLKEVDQTILVYETDGDGEKVPVKTLKLINNSPFTVYPVMRSGNEAALASNNNMGLYDPYDPVRMEYRGYIGYEKGGKYYFGLQPKQSILIRIPLVFWNAARMGVVTDGRYMAPTDLIHGNPLRYRPASTRLITKAENDGKDSSLIPNGIVMWYRAALEAPALDAPDQLLEWTIRDQDYLANVKSKNEIPASEKVTLINYDVSYVDNMFLPVAMEALDVPVPAPPYPPGKNPVPYGWIGAKNTPADLLNRIKAFTTDNNALLGSYFGGKGWPKYSIPKNPDDKTGGIDIKIPAGQNIFAQSPLNDQRSSYSSDQYMLTSSGEGGVSINIGGEGNADSGKILTLSRNADSAKVKLLQPGFRVVGYAPASKKNPIKEGTVIEKVNVSPNNTAPSTVVLSQPLQASQEGANFDFFRPVSDYATDAMVRIWYSWAKHYLDKTRSTPTKTAVGAVKNLSATLSFREPQTGLIEGMQVTGPGLLPPDPAKERGGVIVLAIAEDGKSVTLSQLANEDHPVSEGKSYTFIAPQPLPATPPAKDLYTYDFSGDPKEASRDPDVFAKKVYLIMASMAQIPKNTKPDVKSIYLTELMNNVVGGNVGFIFDTTNSLAENDKRRFSEAGLEISALIRDMIKSVLRGVTDFMKFSEHDEKKNLVWYPDPKVGRGGKTFNVYNLDPFVWFVHVPLEFSGYGFSLDDDTADVGAGEATKLQMTIGGIHGMPNVQEWTIQAPYGPIKGGGNWDPELKQSFFLGITDASNTSPIIITSKLHGLANGDKVIVSEVNGNTAANGTFKVANATKDAFQLVNLDGSATAGNGQYAGGGKWTMGPLHYISGVDILSVYWKLKGDDRNAGFQGALLEGPGVTAKGSIRLQQLGDDKLGILAISSQLKDSSGNPLPKGYYEWTFSGK